MPERPQHAALVLALGEQTLEHLAAVRGSRDPRGAMDIDGLSYARVEQLVNAGLVHDVGDLYALAPAQVAALDRFAAKSADALVSAIAASKAQPLSRLLFGLGIRHVGQEAAAALARRFGALEAITGLPHMTLQPNSGANGEYAGLTTIRNYQAARGEGDGDAARSSPPPAPGSTGARQRVRTSSTSSRVEIIVG